MNEKIQNYVNELFKDAPNKRDVQEVKEELLANMSEKYNDLLQKGVEQEEAFSIVAAGVGDVDALIADMGNTDRMSVAELAGRQKKGNLLVAVGIALFVFSVAALLSMATFFESGELGVIIMLSIDAIALAFVIYGSSLQKTRHKKEDDTFAEEYRAKITKNDRTSRLRREISGVMWSIIVLVYLALSFFTGRWELTWIVFLLGAILQQGMELFLTKKINYSGILWTSAVILYFVISFTVGGWSYTWMIFLVAAVVQQIIRLVTVWREK